VEKCVALRGMESVKGVLIARENLVLLEGI
jgi:hypothetical protein